MKDQYKCDECDLGICYSMFGDEIYPFCNNKPYWRALTEAIGRE